MVQGMVYWNELKFLRHRQWLFKNKVSFGRQILTDNNQPLNNEVSKQYTNEGTNQRLLYIILYRTDVLFELYILFNNPSTSEK